MAFAHAKYILLKKIDYAGLCVSESGKRSKKCAWKMKDSAMQCLFQRCFDLSLLTRDLHGILLAGAD